MTRGDLVAIAVQGDFGKQRPALVIQADLFSEYTSTTVLPITCTLVTAPLLRVTIKPSAENGLRKPSQVMADKAMTVKREKVGAAFGRIDPETMVEIERCVALFLTSSLAKEKPPILGLIQRGGEVVLRLLENVQQKTIQPVIRSCVAEGTRFSTDEYDIDARLSDVSVLA